MKRRVSTILLIIFLLSVGLFGLRSSNAERALAEPRPRPLSQTLWMWTANVKVNDDAGTARQEDPAIAVDPSGNAYAVWEDKRNGHHGDIYFSYRPAGGSWGANIKVSDDLGTASQGKPAIAVDSSGNAYAVWEDERNGYSNTDIYFSYRPAGGSWGANIKVSDDLGTAWQEDPAIAVDSSGNAYAVWDDFRNGVPLYYSNSDIYFSYRPAGGSWGANVRVNDDQGTEWQGSAAIAVDSSGNGYAVWYDYRNANPDIYFSYRPAGGDWGTNVRVNDNPGTASSKEDPAIAVDSLANAYAVWADWRNRNGDIYFSYRPAGGSWGTNVKVNDDWGSAEQYSAGIAVDPSGNAYAAWADLRNDPDGHCFKDSCVFDIYFSYWPAGGSWGTNVKVNDDPGTVWPYAWHYAVAIAVTSPGNAYAVWEDDRNGNYDIYFSYGLWWEPTSSFFLPIVTKNY